MAHFKELIDTRYIQKDEVKRPLLVTITGVRKENVAPKDQPEQMKAVISFAELTKPMVANNTNLQLISVVLGEDDTDRWIGRKVVLYYDPTISFGGKIVGGIRVRGSMAEREEIPF